MNSSQKDKSRHIDYNTVMVSMEQPKSLVYVNSLKKYQQKNRPAIDIPLDEDITATTSENVDEQLYNHFQEDTTATSSENFDQQEINSELTEESEIEQDIEELEEIIMDLPADATHMMEKREKRNIMKLQIHNINKSRTFKMTAKNTIKKTWKNITESCAYAFDVFTIGLYNRYFSQIEGKFGSGCVSYFSFIRWLFVFNFVASIIAFSIFVFPTTVFNKRRFTDSVLFANTVNQSDMDNPLFNVAPRAKYVMNALSCTKMVEEHNQSSGANEVTAIVLDFLQGTGWMLDHPIFIGSFKNETTFTITTKQNSSDITVKEQSEYNTPVSVFVVLFGYILFGLFVTIASSNTLYRTIMKVSIGQKFKVKLANEIFVAWDFGLCSEKVIKQRQRLINTQLKSAVIVMNQKRKAAEKPMIIIRTFTNISVLVSFAASSYLMYYATQRQEMLRSITNVQPFIKLIIEFLPQLTLTILNIFIPIAFGFIMQLEEYSPSTEVIISLFRIVCLKLISLATLLLSMGSVVLCGETIDERGCGTCVTSGCWENYVGQEMYKLVVLDFFISLAVQPPIDVLRWVVNTRIRFLRFIPQAELEISIQVLNLIYIQSVCFMGAFFCPYIVPISCLRCGLLFHIKRWTLPCLQISSKSYRTAKLERYFLDILLFFYLVILLPLCMAVFRIQPSKGCSPFRVYSSSDQDYRMVTTFTNWIDNTWVEPFNIVVTVITSTTLHIFVLIVLIILIYFYYSVLSTENQMINLLQHELDTETHSKHDLLQLQKQLQREQRGWKANIKLR